MEIKTYDITGMKFNYADTTQKMIWAGIKFLQENNVTEFDKAYFYDYSASVSVMETRFLRTLKDSIKTIPTDTMEEYAINTALFIHFYGYKNGVKCAKMMKNERKYLVMGT